MTPPWNQAEVEALLREWAWRLGEVAGDRVAPPTAEPAQVRRCARMFVSLSPSLLAPEQRERLDMTVYRALLADLMRWTALGRVSFSRSLGAAQEQPRAETSAWSGRVGLRALLYVNAKHALLEVGFGLRIEPDEGKLGELSEYLAERERQARTDLAALENVAEGIRGKAGQ